MNRWPTTVHTGAHPSRPVSLTPAARVAEDLTLRFERAITLMQDRSWHEAFDVLAALADGGHVQAAGLALLFTRRGTSLFGGTYQASPSRREAWLSASH